MRRNALANVSLDPYQGGGFQEQAEMPQGFGAPPELNMQVDFLPPPQPPQDSNIGSSLGSLGSAFINRRQKPPKMYDSPMSLHETLHTA